jgi:hypothetical protein
MAGPGLICPDSQALLVIGAGVEKYGDKFNANQKSKRLLVGLMFATFGIFFAGFGTQYTFGTGARMGPGYFPTVLGILLIILGVFIALMALSSKAEEHKVARFSWPTILLILGSVVLFGLMLTRLGLIISLMTVVLVSSYASHEFGWKAAIINTVVLMALCLSVFVYALSLQFPLWPTFLGA